MVRFTRIVPWYKWRQIKFTLFRLLLHNRHRRVVDDFEFPRQLQVVSQIDRTYLNVPLIFFVILLLRLTLLPIFQTPTTTSRNNTAHRHPTVRRGHTQQEWMAQNFYLSPRVICCSALFATNNGPLDNFYLHTGLLFLLLLWVYKNSGAQQQWQHCDDVSLASLGHTQAQSESYQYHSIFILLILLLLVVGQWAANNDRATRNWFPESRQNVARALSGLFSVSLFLPFC